MKKYVLLSYGDEKVERDGGGEAALIGPLDFVGMMRSDLLLESYDPYVLACLQTSGGVVAYNSIYYSQWAVLLEDELEEARASFALDPQTLVGGDHEFPMD